ncbi:hypothetical protein B273_0486 [SAR86 cluster bacterium SAR86E]|uniref:Uncharacterized protein n=1 Tax=SAR86 cluster bacterium SAR86E TaxID=1208365 RepID=K6GFT4_9GAMM|nr:hypothetical protein B273_0486 [SAR86 cluster bacterium SAR86E]
MLPQKKYQYLMFSLLILSFNLFIHNYSSINYELSSKP